MSSGGGSSRRARRDEGHKPNHERWMVSYADLLTLMLALFIVLYATSVQNTSKMKQMAASMLAAFSGTPPALISRPSSPHGPMNNLPKAVTLPLEAPKVPMTLNIPQHTHRRDAAAGQQLSTAAQKDLQPAVEAMSKLNRKLHALLLPEVNAKTISIASTPLSIRIRLNAKILFANGDATLTPGAVKILTPLARTLSTIPAGYGISIHGYTDNKPIHTAQFPSNWQLSTARALSVVMLFRAQNVPGEALSAAGFSKYHPIASNDTDAGRQQNRRVSIVITAPKPGAKTAAQDQRHGAVPLNAQPQDPAGYPAPVSVPAAPTPAPAAAAPAASAPAAPVSSTSKAVYAPSASIVPEFRPSGGHHG